MICAKTNGIGTKQRATELALGDAGRESTWGRESLQASLDAKANADRIDKLKQLGVVTEPAAASMHARETAERDRRIREAKYGNQTADGSTGFGSADVKSVGGFNAMLKGIRAQAQSAELSELKKNGDISAEINSGINKLVELGRQGQSKVVEFF